MSTTSRNSAPHSVPRSEPIPIGQRRGRSASLSSYSPTSSPEVQTPMSGPQAMQPGVSSPSSSPILSYFFNQSPKSTTAPGTFPFRKFSGVMATAPVTEEDNVPELPASLHARRASTTVAGKFSQHPVTTIPEPQLERGASLLRRLSLSSPIFTKPQFDTTGTSPPSVPPNSAITPSTPVAKGLPFGRDGKPRRSATISTGGPRRAPSPMGERILKGHFDGFN